MKAWHFINEDRKLGYGDDRHVRVGRTYKVKGDPVLCKHGLHASVRLIDALGYAHSSILTRVELGGLIVKGHDKAVATERTVLWMGDISDILHNFACDEAERALKLAKVKDQRSWEAIRIKRLWILGKATDGDLSAAGDAARSAAGEAARSAARSAAKAAMEAARSAARDAARSAAKAAARSVAKAAAARDAAWEEAWAAAWVAQNKRLTAMVLRRMKR